MLIMSLLRNFGREYCLHLHSSLERIQISYCEMATISRESINRRIIQSILPGTILFHYVEEGSSKFFRNDSIITHATVIFVEKRLQKPLILRTELCFKQYLYNSI